jgi:hypothetical protein
MFYVYEHIRNDTNQCFYVGKGTKSRCAETHNRNKYWKNVVKKAGGFSIEIVEKDLTNEQAIELEIKRIVMHNELGSKLTNMTLGGEGFSHGDLNPAKRPEIRQFLSENVKGDKNPFKREDVRKKISGENHYTKKPENKLALSMRNQLCKKVIFEGVEYYSVKALADVLGMDASSLRWRIRNNPDRWGYKVIV